jgi:hypothetical protein
MLLASGTLKALYAANSPMAPAAYTGWREEQYSIRKNTAGAITFETITFPDPTKIVWEAECNAYRVTATAARESFRKVISGSFIRMGATTDHATQVTNTGVGWAGAAGVDFTVTTNTTNHTLAMAAVGATTTAVWAFNTTFRWKPIFDSAVTTA